MALALYRKYRPRTFAEVIGQEHVTEPLSQALRSGRLHHAYLFSGPRGCGKTSSARILARSLNCEQGPTPEPCGVCASCRSLANDATGSIDVIEIDAASHGGVDDARDLREKAFFAPASSRYKIYVIDEAHMVSPAGFNALLKLVEEPPDYVKFIFATTEPEKVLGTIKSRTHHYPFRLIPPAVLRPYLQQLADAEGIHVEPAVFPLVVRAGGGSARDALSLLDQLIAGAGSEGVTYARAVALLGVTDVSLIDEMCDALAAGDGAAAFATIDRVAEAGHDPRRYASDLLERFRDLIILQQVPDAVAKGLIDGPSDQLDAMSAQATRLGPATLSRCADIVHNGLVEMRGTTAPRLLLELLTARMLLPGADDSAGALLQRLERMERRLTLSGGDAPSATISSGDAQAPASTDDGSTGAGRSAARAAAVAAGRRGASDAAGNGAADGAPGRSTSGGGEPRDGEPRGGELRGGESRGGESGDGLETAARNGQARGDDADQDGRADVERESGRSAATTRDGADRLGRGAEPAGVLPDAPEEPSTAEPSTPGRLSAAAIREVWPEIITTLGRKSKRIAALTSGATVRELEGETVVLTFRFPVHADMVSAESEMITEALYESLGGRWQIRCEISGEAGGAGAVGGAAKASGTGGAATKTQAPTESVRPPAQKAASRQATTAATRQREVVTPPASTDGDDDWPEPARPGGLAPLSGPREADAPKDPGAPQDTDASRDTAAPRDAEARRDIDARRDAETRSDAEAGRGAVARRDAEATGAPGREAPMPQTATAAAESTRGSQRMISEQTQPAARPAAAAPKSGSQPANRAVPAAPAGRGLAAARAAAASARGNAARAEAGNATVGARTGGVRTDTGPAVRTDAASSGWSDGQAAEEPPYDPEYDGLPPSGIAAYEGFDPGDEPLDDVLDEKTARETSEQQAMRLLQDAFGAEKIGEV